MTACTYNNAKKVGKTGTYRPSQPRKKHPPPKRSNSDNESAGPSASRKKLRSSSTEDISVTLSHYYRIISFVTVFQAISERVICRNCENQIFFEESGMQMWEERTRVVSIYSKCIRN